jgi:hypothetical protein
MSRTRIATIVMCLALLVPLSGSTHGADARTLPVTPVVVAAPSVAGDGVTLAAGLAQYCAYACEPCANNWGNEIVYMFNGSIEDGPTIGCDQYPCPNRVLSCQGDDDLSAQLTNADYERLLRMLAAGETARLRTFVAEHPRLKLNRERVALQVRGCGGEIAVHIPLSSSQAAELGA